METNKLESIDKEPVFEIVFSLENEIERVQSTIKTLPWFREYGYEKNLRLPKGIFETSSLEDISAAIPGEFDLDLYKEYADYVETEFSEIEKRVEALKELGSFKSKDHYVIKFTIYGTGGSYNSESGEIIINIKAYPKEKIPGIIIHEITHVGIEQLIRKYSIKQWDKERVVDLIDEKLFPGLNKPQPYKMEEVKYIDGIFEKYFPDLEEVIKAVGEARSN